GHCRRWSRLDTRHSNTTPAFTPDHNRKAYGQHQLGVSASDHLAVELPRTPQEKKNLHLNQMTFTDTQLDILVIQEAGGVLNLRGYDMFVQPSITHRRRGTADESTTPTMTLTYVRKDLPTTQEDTTHVNTPRHARTRNHQVTIVLPSSIRTGLLANPQRPSRRYKPSSPSQMLATLFSLLEILTALIPLGAMTARCR
ncbi:unnamed protein product, partial [Ixodes pacificus]